MDIMKPCKVFTKRNSNSKKQLRMKKDSFHFSTCESLTQDRFPSGVLDNCIQIKN